jgi:hypothetical protein
MKVKSAGDEPGRHRARTGETNKWVEGAKVGHELQTELALELNAIDSHLVAFGRRGLRKLRQCRSKCMKSPRICVSIMLLACLTTFIPALATRADEYPSRVIRIVAPYPAGGRNGSDAASHRYEAERGPQGQHHRR